MNGYRVVRRYAQALYEASNEAGALDDLKQDMDALDRLMEISELKSFCLSVNVSAASGKVFIQTAMLPYLGTLTGRTVEFLAQNGRLAALPFLSEALKEEWNRENGITSVLVESASPLDETLKKDVIGALKNTIPGKIEANWKTRADLLGGMSFQWDNRVLDLSLKNRLSKLKRVLNGKSL